MTTTKGVRFDIEAVKAAARGRWPEILGRLGGIPQEVLDGKHHSCPRCGGVDRFRMIDQEAGALFCNACFNTHNGDGIAALVHYSSWSLGQTLRYVGEFLGVQPIASSNGHDKAKEEHKPLEEQADWQVLGGIDYGRSVFLPRALATWTAAKRGTTPEAARAFGVRYCRWPKATREHECIAFIGRMPQAPDKSSAILLYRADGRPFPPVGSLGERKTHLVKGSVESWLWPGDTAALQQANTILKVEGLTDGLAIQSLGLPANWIIVTNACGAESANPAKLDFGLAVGKRFIVTGDADTSGQNGARRFAGAFYRAGASEVRLLELPYSVTPAHGRDLRDWVCEGHTAADFMILVESTAPMTAAQAAEWIKKKAGRPEIVTGVDEARVIDEAVDALAKQKIVYQRGGLVEVVRDAKPQRGIRRADDAPRITLVKHARLRELLASAAEWRRPTGEDDETEPCHPPDWAVRAVDARNQWEGIPRLEAVTEVPILRPDGTILQVPGYDADIGILYRPARKYPPIPEKPTKEDVERARDALLEVVDDFCFAAPIHRAAWLTAVLTPPARHAYAGPTPLFAIDANVAGCGKTLLATVTTRAGTGRDADRMAAPKDDDECRKRITAIAACGAPVVLIDNVPGSFGCPSLDAALTATSWSDRVLGRTEMLSLPLYAVWFATGNNVVFVGDTYRRVLPIRLRSQVEKPEERTGFKHPRLAEWVAEESPRLVAAAITILAGYTAAGQPDMHLTPWGSFEGWSDLVRSAVVWAGLPDPAATRAELASSANEDVGLLRRLIAGWEEIDPASRGMAVADALRSLREFPDDYQTLRAVIEELTPSGKEPNARSIGQKIRHQQERVVDGRFFHKKDSDRGALWRVSRVELTDSTDSTDSSYSLREERLKGMKQEKKKVEGAGNTVSTVGTVRPSECPHDGPIDEHPTFDGYVNRQCRQCGEWLPCTEAKTN